MVKLTQEYFSLPPRLCRQNVALLQALLQEPAEPAQSTTSTAMLSSVAPSARSLPETD